MEPWEAISKADTQWVEETHQKYAESNAVRLLKRNTALDDIRHKLNAEYVIYIVAQFDWEKRVPAMLEFYSTTDDFIDFQDRRLDSAMRGKTKFATYTRTSLRANIEPVAAGLTADIIKTSGKTHFTVDASFLGKCRKLHGAWEAYRGMRLAIERRGNGLGDMMFTLRRHTKNLCSAIGYHRKIGQEPFSPRDRELAQYFSFRNDDIIHRIMVDSSFDATVLTYEQRYLLPLLLTEIPLPDLLILLGEKEVERVRSVMRSICRHMGIEENRDALKAFYRVGSFGEFGLKNLSWKTELQEGLENLGQ